MTVIPNFILKRMYRAGSFRRVPEGTAFDIVNNLGPGMLTRINGIELNGTRYDASHLYLVVNDELTEASAITEEAPAAFFLNQIITCIVRNGDLPPGDYVITLDLISKEAGRVTLTVNDKLSA